MDLALIQHAAVAHQEADLKAGCIDLLSLAFGFVRRITGASILRDPPCQRQQCTQNAEDQQHTQKVKTSTTAEGLQAQEVCKAVRARKANEICPGGAKRRQPPSRRGAGF